MDEQKGKNQQGAGRGPFFHRISGETLLLFRGASAEAKLQWLQDANEFVQEFVSEEKRLKWAAFLEQSGKG